MLDLNSKVTVMINKSGIKARLLALEERQIESSRRGYAAFLEGATVDSSEPSDEDQISQAEANAEVAEAFGTSFDAYSDALRIVDATDFGSKSTVTPGAVLQLSGRLYVVAVSTEPFDYEGATLMGISPDSPVYKAAEGMQVGDVFEVNGKTWSIDDIA